MFYDVDCPNLSIQKVVMCIVLPLHFYLGIITPAMCHESTPRYALLSGHTPTRPPRPSVRVTCETSANQENPFVPFLRSTTGNLSRHKVLLNGNPKQ